MATASNPAKAEELRAIIREIREKVRARYPQGEVGNLGLALPDLLPLLHARDAAEGKAASIGSVNPRPPGLVNSIIQSTKRQIARALGWFVRDQIEFNRAVITALDAVLEALNDSNRTLAAAASPLEEIRDLRASWQPWRKEQEYKLQQNEVYYLRGLADMRAALEQRFLQTEANFKDSVRLQHFEFQRSVEELRAAYAKPLQELQERFWADLQKVRLEYEALIHTELRVMRQKLPGSTATQHSAQPNARPPAVGFGSGFDYTRFAERFRGSEAYVRKNQQIYVPYLRGRHDVLDVGCGRGELLELLRDADVRAQGIDLDAESVAACRARGLNVQVADVFRFLADEPDNAFDGIVASQVIEHLPPERVPELVQLSAAKLKQGGILALETPNPECLAIFATHFYLDPTHTRPLPPSLMVFYLEEAGFGGIEVHRLSPARESMPVLDELPAGFRDAFFGGLDYAIIGRKL